MKVMTKYEGCDYITPGKHYDVIHYDGTGAEVYLENALEEPDYIILSPFLLCAHLNCEGVWEIVEEY